MFAQIYSAGVIGIQAFPIDVEVDIQTQSLPTWSTVGLPESTVRESKDRVVSAIKNSGYDFLYRKVTINLAPADTRKDGTAFDLPVAIGLLAASGLVQPDKLTNTLFLGELGLTGELRPIKGALPIAILARERGVANLVLPKENAAEAVMVEGVTVRSFANLAEVVEYLNGRLEITPDAHRSYQSSLVIEEDAPDFSDVYGQHQAKRAAEVAAAGGHNILLSGPPGSGKTMLASRIPSILPPLSFSEALETSKIYSVIGMLKGSALVTRRPFRSPHHSISTSGLIGGGPIPKPGEVSLAHNGVLFLDELPEFHRNVIELLRQPLEEYHVTIARAAQTLTFPARFTLVASCNPCPCGYLGHPKVNCRCASKAVDKYRSKLSGPLLDRIDLKVDVPPLPFEDFRKANRESESSATVAARVQAARVRQTDRLKGTKASCNAGMISRQISTHCKLDSASEMILKASAEKFHLSARAIGRVLKVARTIADLADVGEIQMEHVLESLQYRCGEV